MPRRKNNPIAFHIKQQGMTLLEFLISLVLGLFLLTLLSTVYVAIERQHKIQSDLTALQSHFSIAEKLLSQELKQSGYLGCLSIHSIQRLYNATTYALTAANKFHVHPGGAESDMITVWHRSVENSVLLKSMRGLKTLYLSLDFPIDAGDVLIVSDCDSVDIFQVASVSMISKSVQKVVSVSSLHKKYNAYADVGLLERNTFLVEKTGPSQYGLYRTNIKGQKIELVPGVQKMKFFSDQISGVSMRLELVEGTLKKIGYSFVGIRM